MLHRRDDNRSRILPVRLHQVFQRFQITMGKSQNVLVDFGENAGLAGNTPVMPAVVSAPENFAPFRYVAGDPDCGGGHI